MLALFTIPLSSPVRRSHSSPPWPASASFAPRELVLGTAKDSMLTNSSAILIEAEQIRQRYKRLHPKDALDDEKDYKTLAGASAAASRTGWERVAAEGGPNSCIVVDRPPRPQAATGHRSTRHTEPVGHEARGHQHCQLAFAPPSPSGVQPLASSAHAVDRRRATPAAL